MRWNNIPVTLPSFLWKGSLPALPVAAGKLYVQVAPGLVQAVREHLGQSPHEQGGLLLGRLFHQDDRIVAVSVEALVPALEGIGTEISLSMPPSVWTAARQAQHESQVILGWYHSHPDIGAFFSATDRKTQSAFFNQAWSLGWVIDPIRAEQAWFVGPKSQALESDLLEFQ